MENLIQIPAVDIALPGVVEPPGASHGDYGAVRLKPHSVTVACGDHLWSKVGGDSVVTVHGNGG